ncbi:hypothetical protein NXS13_07260 [Corynebacterium sp. ES2730-CONJ]|uniref:hypothetical protein n=1 Tax=Corynebacterium sp. ES2730-CONJ TaxID=2973941 RepID=UPI00216B41C5|nr:hypothetical protein [Corynebacterium sp. ES2730-CONJ]MCS4532303.1 hypothetical protein [Corynebacterium sp. ES2730-CONJ]
MRNKQLNSSLAVDLATDYKKQHGRGDEMLKSLEAERKDVERQLAKYVKAVAQGLFSSTIVTAMQELEERQDKLPAALQKENVKVVLYEDEASIGAFFQQFAKARLDDTDTRAMLPEYFVDKIYVGENTLTAVSLFYDHGERVTN